MSHTPDMAILVPILKDLYNSRLLSGCALTLAVYDWFLVFPDEYETIFQSEMSLPKFLYYFVRIITPCGIFFNTWESSDVHGALTDRFCTLWGFISSYSFLLGMCAGNALLALRLTALYRQKRWVVWFIRCFYVASYAVVIYLTTDGLITFHDNIYYSPVVRVCATVKSSKTFTAVFYAPAAFEFFIFSLTLWRGWQDAQIFFGPGSAPLLMVLYRDGFICFFVMLGVRIWNIWIYATQPVSSYGLGTQMLWGTHAILITRVYMNLVWIAKGPLIDATGMSTSVGTGPPIPLQARKSKDFRTQDWVSVGTVAMQMHLHDEESQSQTTR